MKKTLPIFIFLTLLTLQFNHAFAQPANDVCVNAVTLTSSTTCSYTVVTAPGGTESIPGTTTPGTDDDDVWYKFTAQATTHVITVDGFNTYDPVVEIRSGACVGTGIQYVDASGVGGIETLTVNSLTVGNTYLIRVYHYGTGDGGGTFDICVTHTAPPAGPANDICGNATIIQSSTTCVTTTGSTTGATQSITGTCSGTGDDDVWYRFVAQAANHTVTVVGFGGFDAVLDIRNAPACSASNIMCVDNTSGNGTETANLTNLVVGATYVVRLYHFGTGSSSGSFDICVTHTAPPSGPANDVCGSAIALTSSLTCSNTSGTTTGATQSVAGTCAGTGDDDVWYSFTAVATSHTVKVTGSSGFDAVVDVRSSTSCTGTNISCTDGSGSGGTETANLTGLTVGTTYLVRVYHFTAGSGSGNFDICVTHTAPPAPSNDVCASATSVTSALSCNYTSGSTAGATQSIAGTCSGTADDDVWYSFTAVATDHIVKVQGGSGFDPVIDVRSGACTGTNVSCTDATGAAGIETATLTGLTVGSTYFVRVYHFGTGSGGGSFQICITHTLPSAPTNDLCSSAASLTSTTNCSYTNGTTTGATQSIPGSCGGTGDDDVWYAFTALATSHKVTVQSAAGFDAVIDVRTSPTCSGTNIQCSDNSGAGGIETANLTGLTVGNTYMIRVYHYSAGEGTGNFQICVTHTTSSCTYSISPTSLSFASTGGNGSVTVTTSSSCTWTATTTDSWITITSGSTGTGNGTVSYTVANNPGSSQRTGTITIAGQTHTVAQSGNTSCTFTVSPLSQTFTSAAGTGSVSVTTTGSCNWAATSNDSWITVTSGSTGTGNGTVSYSVTANSGAQRLGSITIAGQIHSVTQSGVAACSYTITPASLSFSASGGPGSVSVSVAPGCNWTATSNDAWISITSGNTGSGNGSVNYTVANNTTTTQRTGTITVAGQTHTVTQNGLQCTYTISPTALSYTASAGTGTVNVTAAAGCTWTATTSDSWITITSGTGSGTGTAGYSVSANTGTSQRLGSLTVAGQTHTVVQNGTSSCTYTLTPSSQTFTAIAGTGSFNITTTSGCSWTAISNDSWIFISSGNTGSGNGTVNFTVNASNSTSQRVGTITIGGQIYTITQSGITCPPAPVMQSVGCSLASNLITNVNYQWYISGTPIIGATSQFYTANQPGFYSVFVTDMTNGCVSSSQPAYVACSGVGIEEFNLADAITIYPNPSSGSFNIVSSGIFTSENVKISIINVYGQAVYSTYAVPQNGEIKLTLNDATTAKGTYTVLFTSGSTQIVKRIIIN